jgi:hypothetical protein
METLTPAESIPVLHSRTRPEMDGAYRIWLHTYSECSDPEFDKVPFTAVLASNDESAVGADGSGKGHIGSQDLAIIGFDMPEARAQVPLLTTVHYPMFEMGYKAVELLKFMRRYRNRVYVSRPNWSSASWLLSGGLNKIFEGARPQVPLEMACQRSAGT